MIKMEHNKYLQMPGLSSSAIKKFMKSPAHYKAYMSEPQVESEAQKFGTLCHLAVLEPEIFTSVKIMPKFDRRTKEGKASYESFINESAGKVTASEEDWNLAMNIAKNVKEHKVAAGMLAGASVEMSGFWMERGVSCKFRTDAISKAGCILDLKTTNATSQGLFARDAFSYGYHISLAFYGLGYEAIFNRKPTGYFLIAVEKTAPNCVTVFDLPAKLIEKTQGKILTALDKFKKCHETGIFPGYEEQVIELVEPAYLNDF